MAKPKLVFTEGRVVLHKADGTTEIRGTDKVIGPEQVAELQGMLRELEPLEVDDATGTEQGD